MKRILIDANIYLHLYQDCKVSKLLPALERRASEVFVTGQIAAEVVRNRLRIARDLLAKCLFDERKNLGIPNFYTSSETELTKRIDAMRKDEDSLKADLGMALERILREVATGKDPVSEKLSRIFDGALSPTEAELNRARLRKELGNPPGKRNDPLGDQVTWEQFVSHIGANKKIRPKQLWIVTKDGDYWEYALEKSNLLLNPYLNQELLELCGSDLQVRCFQSLADALKDIEMVAASGDSVLPEPPALKEIADRETQLPPATGSAAPFPVLVPWDLGSVKMHSLEFLKSSPSGVEALNSALFTNLLKSGPFDISSLKLAPSTLFGNNISAPSPKFDSLEKTIDKKLGYGDF